MKNFSEEIQQFIRQNIKSVDHLKILVFFNENKDQKWTVYNLGKKLYLHHTIVKDTLGFFNKRGFLEVERQ